MKTRRKKYGGGMPEWMKSATRKRKEKQQRNNIEKNNEIWRQKYKEEEKLREKIRYEILNNYDSIFNTFEDNDYHKFRFELVVNNRRKPITIGKYNKDTLEIEIKGTNIKDLTIINKQMENNLDRIKKIKTFISTLNEIGKLCINTYVDDCRLYAEYRIYTNIIITLFNMNENDFNEIYNELHENLNTLQEKKIEKENKKKKSNNEAEEKRKKNRIEENLQREHALRTKIEHSTNEATMIIKNRPILLFKRNLYLYLKLCENSILDNDLDEIKQEIYKMIDMTEYMNEYELYNRQYEENKRYGYIIEIKKIQEDIVYKNYDMLKNLIYTFNKLMNNKLETIDRFNKSFDIVYKKRIEDYIINTYYGTSTENYSGNTHTNTPRYRWNLYMEDDENKIIEELVNPTNTYGISNEEKKYYNNLQKQRIELAEYQEQMKEKNKKRWNPNKRGSL